VRAGYLVSIPLGEDHRYDLVIEKDGIFKSVQVKTGLAKGRYAIQLLQLSHASRRLGMPALYE
jgi:hypothetical protein